MIALTSLGRHRPLKPRAATKTPVCERSTRGSRSQPSRTACQSASNVLQISKNSLTNVTFIARYEFSMYLRISASRAEHWKYVLSGPIIHDRSSMIVRRALGEPPTIMNGTLDDPPAWKFDR